MPTTDRSVVLRYPYWREREGRYYFLQSRRPAPPLDPTHHSFLQSLDPSGTPIAALLARYPEARTIADSLSSAGFCAVFEPPNSTVRRRILIIEPHMDDAVLSVGATMWRRRNEVEFTLLSMAGRSNFTSYYFLDHEYFDPVEISDLRRAESEFVMRVLGGTHIALAELEAPLRYHDHTWTRAWYESHRWAVSGFIAHPSSDLEVRRWTAALVSYLASASFDEVWMPLGLGNHTDHELARSACLTALHDAPEHFPDTAFLYEDVPYSVHVPDHSARIVASLQEAGARLTRHAVAMSPEEMEKKLELLAAYGSQFKVSAMLGLVLECARKATPDGGHAEVMWHLQSPPVQRLDRLRASGDAPNIASTATRLADWYPRMSQFTRLAVLSPAPIGRWADDTAVLLDAFPSASLQVFVARHSRAETTAFSDPRLRVIALPKHPLIWMCALLTLVMIGCPVVLLPGRARIDVFSRFLGPFSTRRLVLATSMAHLVQALTSIAQTPSRREP